MWKRQYLSFIIIENRYYPNQFTRMQNLLCELQFFRKNRYYFSFSYTLCAAKADSECIVKNSRFFLMRAIFEMGQSIIYLVACRLLLLQQFLYDNLIQFKIVTCRNVNLILFNRFSCYTCLHKELARATVGRF